jgi:SAM-dependent methyltransferase
MAVNATELRIFSHLIGQLAAEIPNPPRILLLGYPDVLATAASLRAVGIDLVWASLPKRPTEEARQIWAQHGRPQLADEPMLEAKALFTAFGARPLVSDALKWGGEDVVLDLNQRIGWLTARRLGRFDLIIDPGTIEHCFNVAQAFMNIDQLLAPGGFVYHQTAIAFPNHGFWSISPTTFFDFYETAGYQLGRPKRWTAPSDAEGFVVILSDIHPFNPTRGETTPIIGSYVFRKHKTSARKVTHANFPTQRCYSALSRDVTLVDFY